MQRADAVLWCTAVEPTTAPVLVIMGVSGSGKSTIALELERRLGWAFQEGDDLHPPANVAKMGAGTPLDDADRAPWLDAVAGWIDGQATRGEPGIVTCSALRRRYRDVLRRPEVMFVLLEAGRGVLADRVEHRPGHFMPASLLASQVDALEAPAGDERSITVETTGDPAANADEIIGRLGLLPD